MTDNQPTEQNDATKERDERCEPVAKEIVQILARHNLSTKKMTNEEMLDNFGPAQVEINLLMVEKGLSLGDVNYVWSIVQSIIDQVKNLSVMSVQKAFDTLETKIFAVDNLSDLTLQKVNEMLKLN